MSGAPRPPMIAALLRRHVREFARVYVAVTDALVKEGVPEETARNEGRMCALMAVTMRTELPREPWEG